MEHFNRRKFLTAATVLATGAVAATASCNTATGTGGKTKLVHHVFFWLKNAGSAEDRAKLMEGLETLKGIQEIGQLLIGTPAGTEKRDVVDHSYDVSELMFFNNQAEQDAYQVHPIHKAFVEKYSHLWEKVVVYDTLMM
jgi:hypothetical protein